MMIDLSSNIRLALRDMACLSSRKRQRGFIMNPFAFGGANTGLISPFWPTTLYSMRLRNSAYAGKCVRVRNITAGTESDIGFKSDGWIDEVALAAFRVSANDLRVVKWYDQSGGGLDLVNANNNTTCPRLIDSAGTADVVSGHPAIRWDAADRFLQVVAANASFGMGTGAWAVEAFAFPTTLDTTNTNGLVDFRSATGAGYMLLEVMTDKKISFYNGTRTGAAGTAAVDGALQNFVWSYVGGASSAFKQYIGGVAQSSTTQTFSVGTTRPLLVGNTKENAGAEWPGYICEVAICKGTNQYPSNFTPRSYT